MGLSGYTTVNFLPGHPTFANVKVAADLFYADYRSILLFSIMLGANDSAIQGPAGSPVIPSDYRANLKTMADSLIAAYPNCKIVINYPIWYSEKTHNRGASYLIEGQKRVILYQKEIDTLVDLYQGLKPGHVFMGDKKAYTYFKKNFLTDLNEQTGPDGIYYLHPNEKGDRALAGFWCKAILKALQ
jgi:lysophospholipase L1-like esterase